MCFFVSVRRSWLVATIVRFGLFACCLAMFLFPWRLQASLPTALQKGIALYRLYQFEKAIPWFEKALRSEASALTKKQRLEAYLILSICYYNQTQRHQAIEAFEKALVLDADAKIPPNQAPHVFVYYETLRRDWKQRNPLSSQKHAVSATKKPVRPAFRHTISISLLGAGVLLAGVGIVLQVVSLQQSSTIETTKQKGTGLEVFDVYEGAHRTAWGAVGLWIVSGALAGVAVGFFVHESRTQPQSSTVTTMEKGAHGVVVGATTTFSDVEILWENH